MLQLFSLRKHFMHLVYSILTLVVMLPLLFPGYILTLDMPFTPHPPLPEAVTSSYLFYAVLHYISYIIPGDVLQKIILFGILLLSGVGMHRLMQYLFTGFRLEGRNDNHTTKYAHTWQIATYLAGIFYMVNPFVYGRFMAGQYAVLLGYALLPFFAKALLKFLEKPTLRRVLPVAGLTLAISVVSIHTIGIAALLAGVITAIIVWQRRGERQHFLAILQHGAIGIGAILLLSAYWLIPLLQGQGRTAEQIGGFSTADRQAFATDGGLFSVLQLQGFWAEAQGLFIPAGEPLPLSGLIQIVLWAVIVIGFISAWRHQRHMAVIFGITAALAIGLALDTPLNTWLAGHVPFFAGYREPHKFVALLALAYAVFGAYGAAAILKRVAGKKKQALYIASAAMLLILPFLNTPAMVWGFNGQLTPRHYPADWYAINEQLNQDKDNFKVLFLPWHLYMHFDFAGRIIANPADNFFEKPVIISSDPEFGSLPSSSPRHSTIYKLDSEILPQAADQRGLGARLAALDIKYVLLAKEGDYEDYNYLNTQSDLKLETETLHLNLYRNTAFEVR